MSVLERHPELKEPMERIEVEPPSEPPRDSDRPVRWIAWTFSILVIAAAAIAALIITSDTPESFESIYENGSPLAYGAVNEPGFDVGFRWVGESDMTLEEFEMFQAYEASVGEADLKYQQMATAELNALQASVGEADLKYQQMATAELNALQASVGEADLKYLQMASTG